MVGGALRRPMRPPATRPMRADHSCLATARVGQNITRHLGQTEYVVEFTISQQPSIGGHQGAAKLEHQAASALRVIARSSKPGSQPACRDLAPKRRGNISVRSSASSARLRRSRRSRVKFTRSKSSWRRNKRGWLSLGDRAELSRVASGPALAAYGAGAHEIGQRNRSPTVSDWKNERAAWPPTLMPRL